MKIRSWNLMVVLVLGLIPSLQGSLGGSIKTAAAQFRLPPALPAAGELDPAFGEGGLVTANMYRNSYGTSVALQPDGKIVVAGTIFVSTNHPQMDFGLTRYNSDGSLDTTFGSNGIVVTDFDNTTDYGYDIAIQTDGKIVLAGSSATGWDGYFFALVRYNSDGSLDPTFGTGGKVSTHLGDGMCFSIVLQDDGKIVATGGASDATNNYGIGLVRYNSDGSLDNTFGQDGIVTTFSPGRQVTGHAVTLLTDGRFIVAGFSNIPSGFALARYSSNGDLDLNFGTNGIVTTGFGEGLNAAGLAIAIQSVDQKMILAGLVTSQDYYSSDFALARYNPDGSLDDTFGIGGKLTIDFGTGSRGGDVGNAVELQVDGRIIVAGGSDSGDFALMRLANDGSLDASFGTGGKVITDFVSGADIGFSTVLQADGRIILAGQAFTGHNDNFALARYKVDGSLDLTFGSAGKVITTFGGGFNYDYAVALQADGKSVMAGASSNGRWFDIALTRMNTDGSLDANLGSQGKVLTRISSMDDFGYAVAVQPDNKIVVAGSSDTGSDQYMDFALVRYNNDGSLDITFGSNGIVTTDFNGTYDDGRAMFLQPDGKTVIAGYSRTGMGYTSNFALARYNSDGSLDSTFGTNGKVTTDFTGKFDVGYAAVLQPDGKIVMAGATNPGDLEASTDFALARYHADGSLDAAFGSNGKVITDFGGADYARALALQNNGKIVVTGDSNGNSIIARYNKDGSLDHTFGTLSGTANHWNRSGKMVVNSGGNDHSRAVVVQADGKIMVGGDSEGNFALTRFNDDGSLDATFGTNGKVLTNFGGSTDVGQAMALQADSKVILAGYTSKNNQYNFAAARYFTSEPEKIYLPLVSR